jgi:hypothetical protein
VLPRLILRLSPDSRCVRCSQFGYVEHKCRLCMACMNISLKLFERQRIKEAFVPRGEEEYHGEVQEEKQKGSETQAGAGGAKPAR